MPGGSVSCKWQGWHRRASWSPLATGAVVTPRAPGGALQCLLARRAAIGQEGLPAPRTPSVPAEGSAPSLGFPWWGDGPFRGGAGVRVGDSDWVIKAETLVQDSFKTQAFSGSSQRGSLGFPWRPALPTSLPGGGGESWRRGAPRGGALTVPSLLQCSRSSPGTGQPPSRRHPSVCLAALGDGWRTCPAP